MGRFKGILIIVLLLVGAVILAIFTSRTPSDTPSEVVDTGFDQAEIDELRKQRSEAQAEEIQNLQDRVETERRGILTKASITFPAQLGSDLVDLKSLPSELTLLIDENQDLLRVLSTRHENSKDGFTITYALTSPLDISHSDFISGLDNSWQVIFEESKDLFAVVELENNDYQVRVSRFYAADEAHTVLIQTIKK